MDQSAIERAAYLLWQAQLSGSHLDTLPPDCRPYELHDGYAIQDAIAAQTQRAVLGWKLAITSEAGQRRLGISEPLAGRLFADAVYSDGATLTAGRMHMRVAEGELAFRLRHDLPPRETAYGLNEVMETVEDVYLAIEVPDSRFERYSEMAAPEVVADNGYAASFVLGPRIADWRKRDLARIRPRGSRNGLTVEDGLNASFGDPRTGLVWLAGHRAKRGEGLKSGDIIITGTRLTPMPFSPGDRISIEFEDLGTVAVVFD